MTTTFFVSYFAGVGIPCPTKKPKKGWKIKTAPLDPTEIPEADIIVGAMQEVNFNFTMGVKLKEQ